VLLLTTGLDNMSTARVDHGGGLCGEEASATNDLCPQITVVFGHLLRGSARRARPSARRRLTAALPVFHNEGMAMTVISESDADGADVVPAALINREHLSYRQRRLIELCVDQGQTLEAAARIFNISRERVRQVLADAGIKVKRDRRTYQRLRRRDLPPVPPSGTSCSNSTEMPGSGHTPAGGNGHTHADTGRDAANRCVLPELMGTAEVAEALGVSASNLQFIQDLPEPVQTLRATRIWLAQDIREFAQVYASRRDMRHRSRAA
jgi:hypothetical protein